MNSNLINKRTIFSRHRVRKTLFASIVLFLSTPLYALEVDPGDYTALPAGTNLGIIYAQTAERDSFNSSGHKVAGDGLDSDIGILRAVHFTEIGGYIVDPQFLLPFGRLKAEGDFDALGNANGVGDLILAMTTWLVNKPEDNTYFGITPFLYVPIGDYDKDDALNLGENRWKFVLQAGLITELAEDLLLDVVVDTTLHGDNDEFGPAGVTMEQDASYSIQTYLRYNITPSFDIRAGFIAERSGETTVAGVGSGDASTTTRGRLGIGWFFNPTTQLLVGYGEDFDVDNGFKESSRLNLRILTVF